MNVNVGILFVAAVVAACPTLAQQPRAVDHLRPTRICSEEICS